MSFFNWLRRKSTVSTPIDVQSTGLGQLDVTVPTSKTGGTRPKPGTDAQHSKRKVVRLEQRELLYAVVRECMTKSGILSTSYKFKVLSLDSRGKTYLVMVDLPSSNMSAPRSLLDIEGLIARLAKALHGISVTAVYWRVNEQAKLVSLKPSQAAAGAGAPLSRQQHIDAFKKSFPAKATVQQSSNAVTPLQVVAGQLPQGTDFIDTEIEEFHSPMSGTQYGDLN